MERTTVERSAYQFLPQELTDDDAQVTQHIRSVLGSAVAEAHLERRTLRDDRDKLHVRIFAYSAYYEEFVKKHFVLFPQEWLVKDGETYRVTPKNLYLSEPVKQAVTTGRGDLPEDDRWSVAAGSTATQ